MFDAKAQFSVGTSQAVAFTFWTIIVTYNALSQQPSCKGVVDTLAQRGGNGTFDSLEVNRLWSIWTGTST